MGKQKISEELFNNSQEENNHNNLVTTEENIKNTKEKKDKKQTNKNSKQIRASKVVNPRNDTKVFFTLFFIIKKLIFFRNYLKVFIIREIILLLGILLHHPL